MERVATPKPVKFMAICLFLFGLLAFFGSVFLWGEGFIWQPPAETDLSFPISDILVNAPASILAAVGLWKLKRFGYVASQFVAGFYTYASVKIFVMAAQQGPPYPVEIVLPQVLAVILAAALVLYLWRIQELFQ